MNYILIVENKVPTFIYGTAWKEERTQYLVQQAVKAGFRCIDTANQRRHYYEAAVGEALDILYNEGHVKRTDMFLQTKFTYVNGQDHRIPYDPHADFTTQVNQSFTSSLSHLKTSYVDSYILHGPSTTHGLTDADWETWNAMTELYKSGKAKLLGISNVNYEQLELLIKHSDVKLSFVQNRCFAHSKWDQAIRYLCRSHSIIYQGFSLLTANANEFYKPALYNIINNHQRSLPQVIFRFALQSGMIPLTGTTSENHMKENLEIYDFELSDGELKTIENIFYDNIGHVL